MVAYRGGTRVARLVPRRVGHRVTRSLGPILRRLLPRAAAQVGRNAERIAGRPLNDAERRSHVEATLGSYATYWFDALRGMRAGPGELDALIDIDGVANLDAAVASGSGAVCVMAHLGNWDHGGAWLAGRYPLTVVAEELRPPELFEWFVELRRHHGMEVVALGPAAAPALMRRLRSGGVIGLLCDRDIDRSGIPVRLLGEPTTMSPGPATLALRTGAAVLPTASVYVPGGRVRGIIGEPVTVAPSGSLRADVAALTQAIADALGELIRRFPDQWHVLQPTWPTDQGYQGPGRS